DAGRPVQHRQPGADEVRDENLAFAIAAEEEQGVDVGVPEGRQALVRGARHLGPPAHAGVSANGTPTEGARAVTYSSGVASKTSTSRRRQNSRSTGLAAGWTAQDR